MYCYVYYVKQNAQTQAITRINRCKPTKTNLRGTNCFYSCGLDKQWCENSLLSSDDEMIFTKQILQTKNKYNTALKQYKYISVHIEFL